MSDLKHGLVIIAENCESEAVGYLMFTYEWSDWRDGVFLWLQGGEVSDP